MSLALLLVAASGAGIAYMNGANDVSKGIATLVGSGVANYRRAILWGTLCTGFGGLAGAFLAGAMVQKFGAGLLAEATTPTFTAALSTILGAAVVLAGVAGGALRGIQKHFQTADCVCVDVESAPLLSVVHCEGTVAASPAMPQLRFTVAPAKVCAVERPRAFGVTVGHLHWITSGATSFARGMNDAPKMVAILLAASLLHADIPFQNAAFFVVTLGMVAGSWMAGRRITTVLAEKITPMDHTDGLLTNLITAVLVAPGALLGLPMSTTHVSSGAIIGMGLQNGEAVNWKTVRRMLLAWVVTLPAAGLLSVVIYLVLLRLLPGI